MNVNSSLFSHQGANVGHVAAVVLTVLHHLSINYAVFGFAPIYK